MGDESFRLVMCDAQGQPTERVALSDMQRDNAAQTAAHFRRVGYCAPWVGYIAVLGTDVVGGGAFVQPAQAGRVEIAYYTEPGQEGRGFATRTAQALVYIARAAAPGVVVFAKTLPEQNASTRILEKLGFAFAGETTDEDVGRAWLWELAPHLS